MEEGINLKHDIKKYSYSLTTKIFFSILTFLTVLFSISNIIFIIEITDFSSIFSKYIKHTIFYNKLNNIFSTIHDIFSIFVPNDDIFFLILCILIFIIYVLEIAIGFYYTSYISKITSIGIKMQIISPIMFLFLAFFVNILPASNIAYSILFYFGIFLIYVFIAADIITIVGFIIDAILFFYKKIHKIHK